MVSALVHAAPPAATAPLLPLLILLLLPSLAGFVFQTAGEAAGAGVGFEDGGGVLDRVVVLRHRFVAHGVFGVFETAAFEEDVLRDAHGR